MSFSKLLYLSGIDFGISWLFWGVAYLLKTDKLYELAFFSTFALLAFLGYIKYSTGHPRAKIQTAAILIWAAPAWYSLDWFSRFLGWDGFFMDAKNNPSDFIDCTMQGVLMIFTLLPSLLMIMKSTQPTLNPMDWLGWTMWYVGFVFEVLADFQERQFDSDPANADKFINTGLWSISRHPIYFGAILIWSGLFVSASSSFTKWWEYLTILSPMFWVFFITKKSDIPLLESYGLKKWGHLPEYQVYLKNTAVLVPFFY